MHLIQRVTPIQTIVVYKLFYVREYCKHKHLLDHLQLKCTVRIPANIEYQSNNNNRHLHLKHIQDKITN